MEFEKLSAILIFKAVRDIYYAHDAINIDTDFQGKTRGYVGRYLKRLFLEEFLDDSKRNNPAITFVSSRTDERVKDADRKASSARHKEAQTRWQMSKDPSIIRELSFLR